MFFEKNRFRQILHQPIVFLRFYSRYVIFHFGMNDKRSATKDMRADLEILRIWPFAVLWNKTQLSSDPLQIDLLVDVTLRHFISNKQADDYFEDLGYDAHKEEFCHRRGVFFTTTAAPLEWHVPRQLQCVAPHGSASPRCRTSQPTVLPL